MIGQIVSHYAPKARPRQPHLALNGELAPLADKIIEKLDGSYEVRYS